MRAALPMGCDPKVTWEGGKEESLVCLMIGSFEREPYLLMNLCDRLKRWKLYYWSRGDHVSYSGPGILPNIFPDRDSGTVARSDRILRDCGVHCIRYTSL